MIGSDPTVLARIGQIFVTARDLDRARAFYRDTLGLAHLFDAPNMAFFDCGGVRLMLGRPERPEFDHPGSILYFEVGDIAAAHLALAGRGVTFERAPERVARLGTHDLWLAFFRDSEANLLALMANVPAGVA